MDSNRTQRAAVREKVNNMVIGAQLQPGKRGRERDVPPLEGEQGQGQGV